MLTIRPARREDAPLLLELVRELATYEREPGAVVATESDYLRHGFGDAPRFEAHIAEWSGAPVGFSLHFFNFSTWTGRPGLYLEDLYVRPSHRGRGIGKALLVHLARIAIERGCARFQWQVLDWNRPAIEFYEGLGARATGQWLPFRIEGKALERLAREAGSLSRSAGRACGSDPKRG